MRQNEVQNIEIQLLIEAIKLRYGYDFTHYAKASLKRRISFSLNKLRLNSVSEMLAKILNHPEVFVSLFSDLSITVTEMFRDPEFYLALREKVFPTLETYPFFKVWHAGCATGEEVYSLAIALKEEGLYDRAQIYATDFNDTALERAKDGIYPVKYIKKYTTNYQKAGGKGSLGDFYHARYNSARMDKSLKKNMTFANHNLVTDGVFGEMNLILCRNVLIYFDKELQNRVFQLLSDSLCRNGFLCLGSKESLTFSGIADDFIYTERKERIHQKKLLAISG